MRCGFPTTLVPKNKGDRSVWTTSAIAFYPLVRILIMTYIAHRQQPVSEQTLAQAELDLHIVDQAQAVAPEDLTTVEINRHHYEIYAGKRLIAYITYDNTDFVTQRWVVMVNGEEKFRHNTQAWCFRFIDWHHKDGTLNPTVSGEIPEVPTISKICFYDHEALVDGELVASISFDSENHEDLYWRVLVNNIEIFRDTTPARCHSYVKQQYQQGTLPVQQPFVEPCTTGNEIMVQIADECEKHGLELLDDGIYRSDVRLGEVGCTDNQWWVIRTGESQEKIPCDSAMDAVYWLSMVDAIEAMDCEQLLDLPFDMLTAHDWQRLLEYQPHSDLVAA
ncbi:hypothetical protein ACN23B_27640 (plasmid) [Anabaena sp. FACHB-709]|nr:MULTISPECIES: hypothetical protein [Nostocaceae]MBD2174378.1 hypothetical protein [Anabaena cylindrica FACHB-318]MBD2266139.1 hypothetical protein [Anabaena sp. FACHB-709]MBD2275559.1 hypothetical protein [Nostoc sp. PCC 7120 = FACHB-418]MBD2286463.1 hypothetical protein [Anabaena cylindrica FACHB-170]MBD2352724.1 hypothetical protein [Trichormus variabilis FACHB-171]